MVNEIFCYLDAVPGVYLFVQNTAAEEKAAVFRMRKR